MPICFVIQPFDGDKFDRRYDDTFRPAIEEIGLEAYRVDQDPSVEVPIDEIERKIRDATVCLADISTNNPNVWYELGYAFAMNKKVLMVCSDEREGTFPFDIQHRTVVSYNTGSRSDYEKLRGEIVKRMKSLLERKEREEVAQVTEGEREGKLSDLEVEVLGIAAETRPFPDTSMSVQELQDAVTSCGISGVGFGLAFRRLAKRGFLDVGLSTESVSRHNRGSLIDAIDGLFEKSVTLTETCWNWIGANAHLFSLDEHGTLKDT